MTLSPRQLMRYHDGDLSPAEAREVEHALADDDQAREHLLALEQLGDLTRVWAEQRSLGHTDLADGVMARIDQREPRRLAFASARRAAPVAASVLALAAAVALFVTLRRPAADHAEAMQPSAHSVRVLGPTPSPSEARSARTPIDPAGSAVSAPAVAIEAVDFGETHGSIFVVSSERGDTPVVWLSDGPAISPPRTHPL